MKSKPQNPNSPTNFEEKVADIINKVDAGREVLK